MNTPSHYDWWAQFQQSWDVAFNRKKIWFANDAQPLIVKLINFLNKQSLALNFMAAARCTKAGTGGEKKQNERESWGMLLKQHPAGEQSIKGASPNRCQVIWGAKHTWPLAENWTLLGLRIAPKLAEHAANARALAS